MVRKESSSRSRLAKKPTAPARAPARPVSITPVRLYQPMPLVTQTFSARESPGKKPQRKPAATEAAVMPRGSTSTRSR